MCSLLFIFMLGCLGYKHHTIDLGAVDTVEKKICNIQLVDGKIITVESDICQYLKEGDALKVVRVETR